MSIIDILKENLTTGMFSSLQDDAENLVHILNNTEPIFINGIKEGFINNADGWGFNKEEISNQKGKLLTLDIDFGSACSLNCP